MKKHIKLILFFALTTIFFYACSSTNKNKTQIDISDKSIVNVKKSTDTEISKERMMTNVITTDFPKMNFGSFEGQDISWFIIAEDDDSTFLLSEYVLDNMPYNAEKSAVAWENSTLFNFLNNDFYNSAFTEEEKEMILPVNNHSDGTFVTIPSVQNLNTLYGETTFVNGDYYSDTNYIPNAYTMALPTETALNNGIAVFDNIDFATYLEQDINENYYFANGFVPYWLMDQYEEEGTAEFITSTGFISYDDVNINGIGYRPIIKIKKQTK